MRIRTDKVTNWVYVTGTIRSGTTFVAEVLSIPREVDYLHEPFNEACGMPSMTERFVYVRSGDATSDTARKYRKAVKDVRNYDFRLRNTGHSKDRPLRRIVKGLVGSRGPYHLRLAKLNPFHNSAIVKDPTAPFLADLLDREYGMRPLIVMRHPVSLASSIARVGWWYDLQDLARQPNLVADYLQDEEDLLNDDSLTNYEKVAVHWRCVYKVLTSQAAERGWEFVKIEDLSERPVDEFRRLYASFGLPWSERVERKIGMLTSGTNADMSRMGVVELQRDSRAIFAQHRDAVAPQDRSDMYELLKDVVSPHYSRDSFAID